MSIKCVTERQTNKYHKNEAFPLMKYIRRYVQNGQVIISVLV